MKLLFGHNFDVAGSVSIRSILLSALSLFASVSVHAGQPPELQAILTFPNATSITIHSIEGHFPLVHVESAAPISIRLDDAQLAFHTIILIAADGGKLSTDEVTFDANGTAIFAFTPGNQFGSYRIVMLDPPFPLSVMTIEYTRTPVNL